MAVRIHVTATQGTGNAIRAVFRDLLGPAFDNVNIESTPPWSFFTTSVWSVNSSKLVEGLQRMESVGLQATTEDACRWYLTIVRPGCKPQTFMHDFGVFQNKFDSKETVEPPELAGIDPRLAFLEPDPAPDSIRPWSQFDEVAESWSGAGLPIDIDFRDRVQSWNYGKAVNEFRKYESGRLADALENARLGFDRKELLEALLWKSVTERERDADIGNLPRVLLALGLKGQIADFFKQQEDEGFSGGEAAGDSDNEDEFGNEEAGEWDQHDHDCEEEDDDQYEGSLDEDQREIAEADVRMPEMIRHTERGGRKTRDRSKADQPKEPWGPDTFLSATLQAANAHDLAPVGGGHVELKTGEFPLLGFLASAIEADQVLPAVLTCLPPTEFDASEMNVPDLNDSNIELRPAEGGWHLALRSLDFMEDESRGDEGEDYLATCIGTDLASLVRKPPDGTRIEVSFADAGQPDLCLRFGGPVVRGKWQIEEAFPQINHDSLAQAVSLARKKEKDKFVLSGTDEAEAVMGAVGRDLYLHNMGVVRDGNTIRCENDGMGFMARLILRHRLDKVWNFAPAFRNIEAEWKKRHEMERTMRRQAAILRRKQSAPADRSNVILRGMESVYWASDLQGWETVDRGQLDQLMSALEALGFRHVGDYVCKKLRAYAQRCLISPDRRTCAVIPAGTGGLIGHEFVSHFANGAHLTTSTSWLAQSHPEVENYAQYCPGLETAGLHERHLWGIGRFRTHKLTEPVELDGTLAGICRLFDEMLGRMKNVESGLISVETIGVETTGADEEE